MAKPLYGGSIGKRLHKMTSRLTEIMDERLCKVARRLAKAAGRLFVAQLIHVAAACRCGQADCQDG